MLSWSTDANRRRRCHSHPAPPARPDRRMPLKVATWNVNGLRARQGQFLEWLAGEAPDIVCLQEIKCAAAQLPLDLCDLEHYWAGWHGEKGYSGVGLLVSKALAAEPPAYGHPPFDFEQRVITTTVA